MALALKRGDPLPFFRLATVGGTSRAIDDFLGTPALYAGWASWDHSRDALGALQAFHARHRGSLEVVAIAFDVQGPEYAMKYLKPAGCAFTMLIDACCELSRQWGARSLPFCVLADEHGRALIAAEAWNDAFFAQAEAALAGPRDRSGAPARPRAHGSTAAEILLQSCANLLGRGRKEEALVALQQALEHDPDNPLIRKQMWAIGHPERFYSGPIDMAWQQLQADATRSIRPAQKR